MQQKPAPFLLDVRQPEEFHEEHIAGAKLIPLNELGRRLQGIPRDREIVCVCRSGNRSGIAVQQLNGVGFKASNLRGGMIAWRRAGFPIRQGFKVTHK
jgi:rhodanese-related sulfurtransferase